jgi:hypothetical protein
MHASAARIEPNPRNAAAVAKIPVVFISEMHNVAPSTNLSRRLDIKCKSVFFECADVLQCDIE